MFFSRKKRISRTQEFRKQKLRHVERNLQHNDPAIKKKRQYIVASVLVGASLSIALYTLFISPIFKIKEVIVSNDSAVPTLDQKQVNDAFQYLLDQNIFLQSTRTISDYGLSSLPRLKDVRISMVYPETVKASVIEKSVALALPMQDQFALINEDGIVVKMINAIDEQLLKTNIQTSDDQSLNTFYLNQQLFSPEQVAYIINGKGAISTKTGFVIKSATWYPERKEVHYELDKGFSIWLDTDLTIDTQVNKLLSIYPQIQSSKEKTLYIDLRIPERAFWAKKTVSK